MKAKTLAILLPAVFLCVAATSISGHSETPDRGTPVRWKKTVIDRKFRSEGIAVADVNRDGKRDLIAGDVWYEAPSWTMHVLRPIARDYGDGAEGYSECFGCFSDDFNQDGWPDVILIPFPGAACYWYENPRNSRDYWRPHLIWRSACNETPLYADLFGTGKRHLIMGIQPEGQMCWFEVPANPTQPWIPHTISLEKSPGTQPFYHGLGVGDVNGDGRLDVIIPHGWWEQPENAQKRSAPWTFLWDSKRF